MVSDFDDFLADRARLEEVTATAMKRMITPRTYP
jgi:hypothetical protein